MITLIKRISLFGPLAGWGIGNTGVRVRKKAQLWLNDLDELVGFAISENGDNTCAVFAKRGYKFLYAKMIQ